MQEKAIVVPVKGVIRIDKMFGEDEEDLKQLQAMALYARSYLEDFAWCKSIRDSYFGDGVGGIAALFLFWIEPARPDVDEWLWVVVGDIPPAYLVVDDNLTPSLALNGYIAEMSKWVRLAKRGKSSPKVIPVNKLPTPENAELLQGRLKFLTEVMIPRFREAEKERA